MLEFLEFKNFKSYRFQSFKDCKPSCCRTAYFGDRESWKTEKHSEEDSTEPFQTLNYLKTGNCLTMNFWKIFHKFSWKLEKLWKTRMFQKSGKNFEKYEKSGKVLEILKEKEFWYFKNDL